MNTQKPLVILDRDGVINYDSPEYIKSPEEFHLIPGSLSAIARLTKAGYSVVIATNQSGVGRGYYTLEILDKIHQKMNDALALEGGHIDGIYFCPHLPEEGCECRKPKPGLLLRIAEDFKIDLRQALFIGDSLRDWEAAQAVSCPFMFIGNHPDYPSIPAFDSLAAAVEALLK